MLACKRGHEKVVEALVSMGAEIYMRDNRNRTAADTAIRRNHHNVLAYLNNQEQVRRYQTHVRAERREMITRFRSLRMQGKLVFEINTAIALRTIGAIGAGELAAACKWNEFYVTEAEVLHALLKENTTTSTNMVTSQTTVTTSTVIAEDSKNNSDTIQQNVDKSPQRVSVSSYSQLSGPVKNLLKGTIQAVRNLSSECVSKIPNDLIKPYVGCADYHWPAILMK